jgi:hypothetical protein
MPPKTPPSKPIDEISNEEVAPRTESDSNGVSVYLKIHVQCSPEKSFDGIEYHNPVDGDNVVPTCEQNHFDYVDVYIDGSLAVEGVPRVIKSRQSSGKVEKAGYSGDRAKWYTSTKTYADYQFDPTYHIKNVPAIVSKALVGGSKYVVEERSLDIEVIYYYKGNEITRLSSTVSIGGKYPVDQFCEKDCFIKLGMAEKRSLKAAAKTYGDNA